jgi:uncharacterized coiled-coil protein SlyX
VAHLFDNHSDDADVGYEVQEAEAPQRTNWGRLALAAALLAVIGVSSAILWRAFSGGLPVLPSFASGTGPSPAPAAAVADKPVTLNDLQALQQQITGPLQSNAQLLAAQQAEIKRLSDQVAALAAKVEALEHPPASAQASLPASAPPSPAPAAPRKKPAAPKPPASISVGGAPLPAGQPGR